MMRLVFQAKSISVFGTKGIYYGNYTGTDYGRREGALLTTQSASMARSHCRSWATWTIQCIRQSSTLAKGLIQTRNIPLWVQGGTTRDPEPPQGDLVLTQQEVVNRPSLTGKIGTENRTRWWLDIDYVVLTADP